MRKLTSVVAAVAVAAAVAVPATAGAAEISHRAGPKGCKKNRANPSHLNGPSCSKNRRSGNLNHRSRGDVDA